MAKKRNLKMWVVMAVFLVMVLGMSWPAQAVPWNITQLTDNDYSDDSPQISDSNVVWCGSVGGFDREIFFWDTSSMGEPCQVTNNSTGDDSPSISGSYVVWRGSDGDYEIFFWDPGMAEPCQVTDNSTSDSGPQISGSNVVWHGNVGGDWEIFFWDAVSMGEPCQVTDNSYWDTYPQISGTNVVWYGSNGSDYEIFFWDGTTITQLTDNDYSDGSPQISGSNVVWQCLDGDYEIFFWDTGMAEPCQVTDNSYDDRNPQISGTNVVWEGQVGGSGDYEIFFWDPGMAEPCQVTDNSYYDRNPQISGTNVVWYGSDGIDYEIFFWDPSMGEPCQVTDNIYDDSYPKISGTNVVWGANPSGLMGGEEIFMAVPAVPVPGRIIYVDADASGGGDGSSWPHAHNFLQDALAYASSTPEVNEIWVAGGVYKPDANSANPGSDDRTATFQLISGAGLYGGYAGFGEPDPNERDIELYETILSGDINVPDVNTDNSYHVVTGNGTDANAVLDGFTITAGNANGSNPDDAGGGMLNISGSPTVTNCTFNNNSALLGGGIFTNLGSPILVNCTFSGNTSADAGGGIHNVENSPTLTNCTFSGNSADDGGGMFNNLSSPTVTNCVFSGNSAANAGGGMFNENGSSPTVTNCILWGDTASDGNEIALENSSTIDVNYCDVQGGQTDIYNDSTGTVNWGSGNIDADPLFIGPNGLDGIGGTADDEEGYVHLRGYSPCINAGDPGGDYSSQVDIDGQPRVAYGQVDMGADEVFPIAGDFEPDGDVDFVDFAIFANHWLLGL